MKKTTALLLGFLLTLTVTSCGTGKKEPEIEQMKTICELSVMECYYHNVAKYYQEDAAGSLWWKKDKHFWIEYSGVVKLGVDVSRVQIQVEDSEITITLPEAEVLGCKVDSASLTEDSFIVDSNSAGIEAADEVKAFGEAQAKLEETASGDQALLTSARQRVQMMLEKYITNIGDAVGKQYTIKWVYLDEGGKATETAVSEPDSQEEEAVS